MQHQQLDNSEGVWFSRPEDVAQLPEEGLERLKQLEAVFISSKLNVE